MQLAHDFALGSGGRAPRAHQLEAVTCLLAALRGESGSKKGHFLLQHAAGSGKSLTIALLVLSLLRHSRFRCIVVVNDRVQLDSQLHGTLDDFLERHGLQQHVARARSVADLASLLRSCGNDGYEGDRDVTPSIIVTTLQKFTSSGGERKRKRDGSAKPRRRHVAVVVDEAHRSHGKSSSVHLHECLRRELGVRWNLTYFAFSATPGPAALRLFGTPCGPASYRPFHTYTMERAVADGVVLDVLQDYTSLDVRLSVRGMRGGENGLRAVREAAPELQSVIRAKARSVLRHLRSVVRTPLRQAMRGMVVVRSREHVVRWTRVLRQMEANDADAVEVYGAFSGEVDGMSEDGLNSSVNFELAPLLVVCQKLETGFDCPALAAIYLDCPLRGARAVQVLGRLSRPMSGKGTPYVVDFVNTRCAVRDAFREFWRATSLCLTSEEGGGDGGLRLGADGCLLALGDEQLAYYETRMDIACGELFKAVPSINALSPSVAAQRLAASVNGLSASDHDSTQLSSSALIELRTYVEACEVTRSELPELPYFYARSVSAFLKALRRRALKGSGQTGITSATGRRGTFAFGSFVGRLPDGTTVGTVAIEQTYSGPLRIALRDRAADKSHAKRSRRVPFSKACGEFESLHQWQARASSERRSDSCDHSVLTAALKACEAEIDNALGNGAPSIRSSCNKENGHASSDVKDKDIDMSLEDARTVSMGFDDAVARALGVMARIEAFPMVTTEALRETGFGRFIGRLRKHEDRSVRQRAQQLIAHLKRVVSRADAASEARKLVSDGDKFRAGVVKAFHRIFRDRALSPIDKSKLLETARNVEEELQTSVEDKTKFRARARQLVADLKRPHNAALVQRVACGEVSPGKLVGLSATELADPRLESERRANSEAALRASTFKSTSAYGTTSHACPKCHGQQTILNYIPQRDNDFVSKAMCECAICGAKWELD